MSSSGNCSSHFLPRQQMGPGGLYIARELCEANGASLEYRKAGGGLPGACFRLTLVNAMKAGGISMAGGGRVIKNSVLLVDDEPDILELLELTLGKMGLEVHKAGNVREALKKLAAQKFDLCLTDMRMPDGDGLQVVAVHRPAQSRSPCCGDHCTW